VRRALAVAAFVSALAAVASAVVPVAPAVAARRLHRSDLSYRGAFRLPKPVSSEKTFEYGGTALAYDARRRGLFAVGTTGTS
jgi:hypothetical protein